VSEVRSLIKSGMMPSEVFRLLIEQGEVSSNADISKLLDEEIDGLPSFVMTAVINWNRGVNPEREGVGLPDERLNERIGDCLKALVGSDSH